MLQAIPTLWLYFVFASLILLVWLICTITSTTNDVTCITYYCKYGNAIANHANRVVRTNMSIVIIIVLAAGLPRGHRRLQPGPELKFSIRVVWACPHFEIRRTNVERFEATASRLTVSSPPLLLDSYGMKKDLSEKERQELEGLREQIRRREPLWRGRNTSVLFCVLLIFCKLKGAY